MANKTKSKKLKIPKSVSDLRMSSKKFAKKNNIKTTGKGLSKGEKKRNKKRLETAYSEFAINGLNKAVKIVSENEREEGRKMEKVADGIYNIVTNPKVMKRVAKLYKKKSDDYPNLIFLPHMIMNTMKELAREDLTDKQKEIASGMDPEALTEFCERILKPQIKRYRKLGIDDIMAFHLASIIPTTKNLKNNRSWYSKIIHGLYDIAEAGSIDINRVLPAIQKIDKGKSKSINKEAFYEGFWSAFIFRRASNRNLSFNDSQKDLHETLTEKALEYLDTIKSRKCKEILKMYIKKRKNAESNKNDGKRVIKFVTHAESNSPYTKLKAVVQELISDNSSNELYLS